MVENYKEPFMTNYFHMLASGHVKYYMKRWKNLYRYEQQGWEAMNSLIKYYYYHRTQRGGHKASKNGDGVKAGRVESIAKYFQRLIVFKANKEGELMEQR